MTSSDVFYSICTFKHFKSPILSLTPKKVYANERMWKECCFTKKWLVCILLRVKIMHIPGKSGGQRLTESL